MRITTVRRISQIFFGFLFFWFCVVMTLGENWWQLRGWPVNWLMQLDPMVGLDTLLASRRRPAVGHDAHDPLDCTPPQAGSARWMWAR